MKRLLTISLLIAGAITLTSGVQARSKSHRHSSKSHVVASKPVIRTTGELLADQVRMNKEKLKLDSIQSIKDNSYEEEDIYQASNLYDGSWNNTLVHPYKGRQLPDSVLIDVSAYYMPHMGNITSNFGYRPRFRRMHYGTDLQIKIGDPIHAAFDGKVRIVAYQRGYGNVVVIRHSNGLETVYGHLSKHLVQVDQIVRAGDVIALGGNTGRSTGPHLHFETRFLGQAIDPTEIFDFVNKVAHMDSYVFYTNPNTHKTGESLKSVKGIAYHTVKSGDTLFSIASKYGTSVNVLKKINKLRSSKVKVGQIVRTA